MTLEEYLPHQISTLQKKENTGRNQIQFLTSQLQTSKKFFTGRNIFDGFILNYYYLMFTSAGFSLASLTTPFLSAMGNETAWHTALQETMKYN